ncbi:MAG: hypothetical protein CL521_01630 [Actinobacteria bacterium]|nr:hypothetical protein [Actinomycetota bacterium]
MNTKILASTQPVFKKSKENKDADSLDENSPLITAAQNRRWKEVEDLLLDDTTNIDDVEFWNDWNIAFYACQESTEIFKTCIKNLNGKTDIIFNTDSLDTNLLMHAASMINTDTTLYLLKDLNLLRKIDIYHKNSLGLNAFDLIWCNIEGATGENVDLYKDYEPRTKNNLDNDAINALGVMIILIEFGFTDATKLHKDTPQHIKKKFEDLVRCIGVAV